MHSIIFFSSCSTSQSNSTYFIHAVGFETKDEEYKIYALCEESGKENETFFTISENGNTIESATKKLMNQYQDCYFATANKYFILENADRILLEHLSKEICSSNIYPSKSNIYCIQGNSIEIFFKDIKDMKKLDKIFANHNVKMVNSVAFFSKIMSGKYVSLPTFKLDFNKKIKNTKYATFTIQEAEK